MTENIFLLICQIIFIFMLVKTAYQFVSFIVKSDREAPIALFTNRFLVHNYASRIELDRSEFDDIASTILKDSNIQKEVEKVGVDRAKTIILETIDHYDRTAFTTGSTIRMDIKKYEEKLRRKQHTK